MQYGVLTIDLFVIQAGYSPVMLAALTGFERKNDKYIMQRLLRLGNINKESSDVCYLLSLLVYVNEPNERLLCVIEGEGLPKNSLSVKTGWIKKFVILRGHFECSLCLSEKYQMEDMKIL